MIRLEKIRNPYRRATIVFRAIVAYPAGYKLTLALQTAREAAFRFDIT